jgi:hypothetical protein
MFPALNELPGWAGSRRLGAATKGCVMNMKAILAGAAIAAASATGASALSINFGSLSAGPLSSYDGVTFSLSGGPDSGDGIPDVGYGFYDYPTLSLNNSVNSDTGSNSGYPTGSTLTLSFSHPEGDLRFTFNNFGGGNGSYYDAYGPGGLVSSGSLSFVNNFATVYVAGSGITSLVIDNNTGGNSDWIVGVGAIATPEPSTWAMMGLGFAGLAFAGYRSRRTAAAIA